MAENKPIKKVGLGRIEAAIWLNESDDGKRWFRVTIARSYQNGDEWSRTRSFSLDDLPVAAQALQMAYSWIWEREARWSGEQEADAEQIKRASRLQAEEAQTE